MKFALVGISGNEAEGLSIIEVQSNKSVPFVSAEGGFSVSASASFTLPELSHGRYTLVAYISTEDGIRSSDYKAVQFTDINTESFTLNSSTATVLKTDANEIAIELSNQQNQIYTLNGSDISYADMIAFLEERAYSFGYAYEDSSLEYERQSNEWVKVENGDGALPYGSYRLKYEIRNGEHSASGYVIARYAE